jgi:hypothetical protein
MSTKDELLSEFDREWAKIERTCASMGEAQMCAPGLQGEWSMKDILAHISAWEKFFLDRMGYVMTGHHPQYPSMQTEEDVRRFNAQVYEENKDRPLTSVVIEFRSLYQGVLTVIQALNDEQLSQPYTYDFAADHITLLDLIRANTTEHYRQHCPPS